MSTSAHVTMQKQDTTIIPRLKPVLSSPTQAVVAMTITLKHITNAKKLASQIIDCVRRVLLFIY